MQMLNDGGLTMKKPDDKVITAAKIVAGITAAFIVGANVTGCVYGPPGQPAQTTPAKDNIARPVSHIEADNGR